MTCTRTLILVFLTLAGSVALAADAPGFWPQFRGPDRDNISPDTGLLKSWPAEGPQLLWKVTGMGEGFSSITVVGGRIYTQGHADGKEWVFALEEATGHQLWSVAVGPAQKVTYPGCRSTPTVDGTFLYIETVAGDIACLEAQTGKVIWQKSMTKEFGGRLPCWGYSESPLVDGGRLIVTPGGAQASVVALAKRDGSTLWQTAVPDGQYPKHQRDPYTGAGIAAYASAIAVEVNGVRQYIQYLQQGVAAFAAGDGKLLWYDSSSSNDMANCPTPIFHDGYLYSATGWRGSSLVKIELSGTSPAVRLVYENNKMRSQYGGFVLVGGYVYGFSDSTLMCMEFQTGKVMWQNHSVGMGPVLYADGFLYVRGDSGETALVEAVPEGYREHGRFTQPDRSKRPARTYPVVTGGRLYLRDEDVLLCYNVRQ